MIFKKMKCSNRRTLFVATVVVVAGTVCGYVYWASASSDSENVVIASEAISQTYQRCTPLLCVFTTFRPGTFKLPVTNAVSL